MLMPRAPVALIALDKNVLSALMRAPPDAPVVPWLGGQAPESAWSGAWRDASEALSLKRLMVYSKAPA
jgi:hypothetical protein